MTDFGLAMVALAIWLGFDRLADAVENAFCDLAEFLDEESDDE